MEFVEFYQTNVAKLHGMFAKINQRRNSTDEIPECDIGNAPTEGFPWDDLRKILHRDQRMAKVQNGEEILPKFQPLSRTHECYRRQTDL